MAEDTVLAFDIGGTNTRVKAAVVSAGETRDHPRLPGERTERISSKDELYRSIRDVLSRLEPERVEAAVIDVAGPVEGGGAKARLTNWSDPSPVTVDELVSLGLPQGRTRIVNDLFAGSLGLVALLEREGESSARLMTLHGPAEAPVAGHLVFVAPGTGLGSAGIVRVDGAAGDAAYMPIACEVQHTLVPPFDPQVGAVLDAVRKRTGQAPTWEDVVSGRGLAMTYQATCDVRGRAPLTEEQAMSDASAWIAARAVAGEDETCRAALDVYYRCAGRFAQMLALTFLPCAGVFLGGASSIKNRDFILSSRFVAEFLDNRVQASLLQDTPVRLLQAEVNLDGGIAHAARVARERVVVGTVGG